MKTIDNFKEFYTAAVKYADTIFDEKTALQAIISRYKAEKSLGVFIITKEKLFKTGVRECVGDFPLLNVDFKVFSDILFFLETQFIAVEIDLKWFNNWS